MIGNIHRKVTAERKNERRPTYIFRVIGTILLNHRSFAKVTKLIFKVS